MLFMTGHIVVNNNNYCTDLLSLSTGIGNNYS